MLRTQRKSLFTLRKQNFKLKRCNHHIKELPFFGPPLECGVNARAVFFIRFFCFFSWSGKLTYNRLNPRCSLGKEHSSKLHSSKTLRGTVYVIKKHQAEEKRSSCWECLCDYTWIKENSKLWVWTLQPHEGGAHLTSITVIYLSLWLSPGVFMGLFFFHRRLMEMWLLMLIQILQG